MGLGTRGKSKSAAKGRRHARLRKKVVGTEQRPRLVVTRSARHVFVQVVDDLRLPPNEGIQYVSRELQRESHRVAVVVVDHVMAPIRHRGELLAGVLAVPAIDVHHAVAPVHLDASKAPARSCQLIRSGGTLASSPVFTSQIHSVEPVWHISGLSLSWSDQNA